jgi:glutamyl-tRNA reductase
VSIILVGLDHRTAPLDLRERLALSGDALRAALDDLRACPNALVQEAAILSTCNRLEVYAEAAPGAVDAVLAVVAHAGGLAPDALRPHLRVLHDEAAVSHLLRVASGIESVILGETQVLGQVSDAHEAARSAGASGAVLSHLFAQAVHTGKRARAETEISRHTTSVSQAAANLAAGHTRVLVVGAGEMATLAALALAASGQHEITIVNRTYSRATTLARQVGGRALDWLQLGSALAWADAVIAAVTAPRPVLRPADLGDRTQPLLLLDLGLPRNVDPAAAACPGVTLYTLDDLQALVTPNRAHRSAAVPQVEAIVTEEAAAFMEWLHSRAVVPVITDLQRWARGLAETEIAQALNRLDAPDPRTEQVITRMAHRLVGKLLHEPTVKLKAHAGEGDGLAYADTLRELFGLDSASPNADVSAKATIHDR